MACRPREIIRPKDLRKFLPLSETVLAGLIRKGLLKTVKLSPTGRAVGITVDSVVAYQREHMGLEPLLPDDETDPE